MVNEAVVDEAAFRAGKDAINVNDMTAAQRIEAARVGEQLQVAFGELARSAGMVKAASILKDVADIAEAPTRIFQTIDQGPQTAHLKALGSLGREKFSELVASVLAGKADLAATTASEGMHDLWLLQNYNNTHTIDPLPDPTASTANPRGRTILASARTLKASGNEQLITFFTSKNLDNAKAVVAGLVDAAAGRVVRATEGYQDALKELGNHFEGRAANTDPEAIAIVKSYILQMAHEVATLRKQRDSGIPESELDLSKYPEARNGMGANHDRWAKHNNWEESKKHLWSEPFHRLSAEEQFQDLNALASTLYGIITAMGWEK
jgi:hypothetical protein